MAGYLTLLSENENCSVVSDALQPHGLYSPWNSPGQNTGVGSLFLLQGIFLSQGSNPGLLYCRQILHHLSHKGSPSKSEACGKIPDKLIFNLKKRRGPTYRLFITFAGLPVLLQDIAPGTRALITPLRVLADEVAGFWGLRTFIEIWVKVMWGLNYWLEERPGSFLPPYSHLLFSSST